MWGYDGGSWFWMFPTMLGLWGLAIAGIVVLVRFLAAPRYDGYAALDALRRRFENGQISRDEYEQAKKALGW